MAGRSTNRPTSRSRSAPGRREAPAVPRAEFEAEVESVSRGIRDPVRKLRYLRSSMQAGETQQRKVEAVPTKTLRRVIYRYPSHRMLRGIDTRPDETLVPLGRRGAPTRPHKVRSPQPLGDRRWFAGAFAATASAVILAGTYHLYEPDTTAAPTVRADSVSDVAESSSLDWLSFPQRPDRVWLVEEGAQWEQYSNGLHIETKMAVPGTPRTYHVFSRSSGLISEPRKQPVGILFHTSESDIWPLEAEYNESLRDSSHRLLRYIRRKSLYNYVIDRFGRVFRTVEEGSKANHAGNSIWANGDTVYLNLNHSFLGVCFETRWDGGLALPITQAQFAAGRNLTEHLRERYEIPAEMGITHGITSVNPRSHLIGHHLDWARGFPFAAFGLTDAYNVPAPSVALFGFSYDDDFLAIMGRPWSGVEAAERQLEREAKLRGRSLEEQRRERQALYDTWREQQVEADEELERKASLDDHRRQGD